jgi:hypothetical protein
MEFVMSEENQIDTELEKIKIEQEKLRLEKARLRLDEERFADEKRIKRLTLLSIVIPIITVAITVGFGVWSQARQAQTDFILQAAEIIISSEGPSETQNRLRALQDLFPHQLPEDFSSIVSSFDPDLYSGGPSYENKMNFIQLFVDAGATQDEILEMYRKLFPDSLIIEAIEK